MSIGLDPRGTFGNIGWPSRNLARRQNSLDPEETPDAGGGTKRLDPEAGGGDRPSAYARLRLADASAGGRPLSRLRRRDLAGVGRRHPSLARRNGQYRLHLRALHGG